MSFFPHYLELLRNTKNAPRPFFRFCFSESNFFRSHEFSESRLHACVEIDPLPRPISPKRAVLESPGASIIFVPLMLPPPFGGCSYMHQGPGDVTASPDFEIPRGGHHNPAQARTSVNGDHHDSACRPSAALRRRTSSPHLVAAPSPAHKTSAQPPC